MDYKEIISRNGLSPMLWLVHMELRKSIIVRQRLTGEMRILDTK